MALPVTIVASGGLPVIDMAANGFPVTSVASGGLPVTLVAGYNLGIGVTFVSESGAAVTENIVADWDDDTLDLTPGFSLDSTEFSVSDILEMRRSPTDATVLTYTRAQITITGLSPVTLSGDWDFSGDWTPGTWYAQVWLIRGVTVIQRQIHTQLPGRLFGGCVQARLPIQFQHRLAVRFQAQHIGHGHPEPKTPMQQHHVDHRQ